MSSIIDGYNYDIFISYRQKDNKYDGWVTEFADNLKKELEATFKEEISIYFDINPHDGLLETHDVDASLKEKLKCLVFIPIISRTYCDPKSFAWEHELKAFVELATQDNLGLKVSLFSGNVTNRVLPIRIHDLENADITLFESILGGAMRGIYFVYKSPGVNRPLKPNDDPQKNLNKTFYRDQINKVANAIDEIINSLKRIQTGSQNENNNKIPDIQLRFKTPVAGQKKIHNKIYKYRGTSLKKFRKYIFSILFIAFMLFLAFGWKGRINFLGFGRSKRELAKSYVENAVNYFNKKEYEAANAELALALASDPKYSYAWSTKAAVSVRQGDLNKAIRETIEAVKFDPHNHEAAYNMAYALDDQKDYTQAIEWYSKAIKIDSTFIQAYSALGRVYNTIGQPVNAIILLSLAEEKFPKSEYIYLIYKNLGNAYSKQGMNDTAIKYLELSREIKPSEPETNLYLARVYETVGQITKSIDLWNNYIEFETDTLKINEAKRHIKEITIRHLKEIIQ